MQLAKKYSWENENNFENVFSRKITIWVFILQRKSLPMCGKSYLSLLKPSLLYCTVKTSLGLNSDRLLVLPIFSQWVVFWYSAKLNLAKPISTITCPMFLVNWNCLLYMHHTYRNNLFCLKHPCTLSILFNLVPPSQANQQTACHVLYDPEIECKKQNDDNE